MHMPKFSPYPRPKHPNPLTAAQVAQDVAQAVADKSKLVYKLWDGEREVEVIIATCLYGFPSCVLVDFSLSFGVKAENWASYGLDHGTLDHEKDFEAMFDWIATKITDRATGSQFAVGTFSEICAELK